MAILTAPMDAVLRTCCEIRTTQDVSLQSRIPQALVAMKLRLNSSPFTNNGSFQPLLLSRKFPATPRASSAGDEVLNFEDGSQAENSAIDAECPPPESQGEQAFVGIRKNVGNKKVSNSAVSALKRAAAYKKLKNSASSTVPQPGQSFPQPPSNAPEVEIVRGQSILSRLQPSNASESKSDTGDEIKPVDVGSFIEEKVKSDGEKGSASEQGEGVKKPEPKSLAAFERARAYKQQQAEMVAALKAEKAAGISEELSTNQSPAEDEKVVEIEIVTTDGVIKRKLMNPDEQIRAFSNIKDVKRSGVSGIDFAGLGFADKKKAGRPAGLNEGFVAPPTGAIPEVEILTRDARSSQTEIAEAGQENELYKPRVSTWGVFPRPADISKTYGGGRTIRPGDSLETEEERKIREARTQQLLDVYRKKTGLDVDAKVKAEAEQVLKDADRLMEGGRLGEALSLYELAMRKMPTRSELHGLAALQSAVCLDSLSRYDEAKQVYEKLLGHPNGRISKQARRFLFGFQAMEKLKVDGGYKWDTSLYRKYFDSFADGYNTSYKADAGEERRENFLPYAILLLFPIILIFALAASKR